MNPLVTVSKTDQDFGPLLDGSFSRTHYAQPIKNLYVSSSDETVTFKIIEKAKPTLWQALCQWYSLARNIYLVFPILGGVSLLTYQYGIASWGIILFSVASLQMFLMSLTLYNDYVDYIRGLDRLNENNRHKPIIQGLIRPYQARQLSFVFLIISLVFAVACFVYRPGTLMFAGMAFLLGGLLLSPVIHKQYKGISIFAIFILAGPLLVLGYEYLLFGRLSWNSVILGFIFGGHAVKYDFCKQIRDIYYNSKANVVTAPTLLGFEKSKFFYLLLSISHVLTLAFFAYRMNVQGLYALVFVAVPLEVYINYLLLSSPSFLSSNVRICLSLQKLHFTIENCLIMFFLLSSVWLSLF